MLYSINVGVVPQLARAEDGFVPSEFEHGPFTSVRQALEYFVSEAPRVARYHGEKPPAAVAEVSTLLASVAGIDRLMHDISTSIAAGKEEVANLAAEIHGCRHWSVAGRQQGGMAEIAVRWASGWACWYVHQ